PHRRCRDGGDGRARDRRPRSRRTLPRRARRARHTPLRRRPTPRSDEFGPSPGSAAPARRNPALRGLYRSRGSAASYSPHVEIRIIDVTDSEGFGRIPPCADPGFDHRTCDYWEDADRGSKAARLSWLEAPKREPAPAPKPSAADN